MAALPCGAIGSLQENVINQPNPDDEQGDKYASAVYHVAAWLIIVGLILLCFMLEFAYNNVLEILFTFVATMIILCTGTAFIIKFASHVYKSNPRRQRMPSIRSKNRFKRLTALVTISVVIVGLHALTFSSMLPSIEQRVFLVHGAGMTQDSGPSLEIQTITRDSPDEIMISVTGTAKARCEHVAIVNFSSIVRVDGAIVSTETPAATSENTCSGETASDSSAVGTHAISLDPMQSGHIITISVICSRGQKLRCVCNR